MCKKYTNTLTGVMALKDKIYKKTKVALSTVTTNYIWQSSHRVKQVRIKTKVSNWVYLYFKRLITVFVVNNY